MGQLAYFNQCFKFYKINILFQTRNFAQLRQLENFVSNINGAMRTCSSEVFDYCEFKIQHKSDNPLKKRNLIMQYIIRSFDKPDSLKIRLENRDNHVAYVNSQSVKLLLAGPLLDDDSGDPIGTLLIVEADRREDVEDYAENDPYNQAGLFSASHITVINITVNNLV